MVVNHSRHFVDPDTQANTQMIEGFWGCSKGKLKAMHGWHQSQVAAHLDEIAWRWNHKNEDIFQAIIALMNLFYPCNDEGVPQAALTAGKPPIQY